ncbi:hypothetical protein ACJX0J_011553, partial [Zea mays]
NVFYRFAPDCITQPMNTMRTVLEFTPSVSFYFPFEHSSISLKNMKLPMFITSAGASGPTSYEFACICVIVYSLQVKRKRHKTLLKKVGGQRLEAYEDIKIAASLNISQQVKRDNVVRLFTISFDVGKDNMLDIEIVIYSMFILITIGKNSLAIKSHGSHIRLGPMFLAVSVTTTKERLWL